VTDLTTAAERHIWDCFMFNDELALLEFRLRVLDPIVDYFVLIESTRTHTGHPKRACFAANSRRFDTYRAKIRHILVDDMPDASPWVLERFQRAAVWRGLDEVEPRDLVMVGDLDEIPDPSVIRRLATTLQHPTRVAMRHFVFAANFEIPHLWTDGTMVARGDQLREPPMAVLMGDPAAAWSPRNDHMTTAAGCHLSFMGGRNAVATKLRAYAHQEFAVPALTRPRHLERCVALGVHVAGIYAIRRRPLERLPPMARMLAEMHPEFFDFRPGPPRSVVLLYLAYARVRTRLPLQLLAVIDAHPLPFAIVFGPFLLTVDTALRAAAKHRLRYRARHAIRRGRRLAWRIRGDLDGSAALGG
jgi:beta-1,4-mannosyl-glycoprotein beta-1,4-N-acetylglucosaminyltransferase